MSEDENKKEKVKGCGCYRCGCFAFAFLSLVLGMLTLSLILFAGWLLEEPERSGIIRDAAVRLDGSVQSGADSGEMTRIIDETVDKLERIDN